ncbi:MAG: SsrA-binding protein SmpB [Candidatus Pacebacteria bacterium]|nr:SsrA-binding protein SmpB [Candidatus Paceibacterota bacterium]
MDILSENKKAGMEYEILEKFVAGIELKGFEVKSARKGSFAVSGASCVPEGAGLGQSEMFLINSDIHPYQNNNSPSDYNSKRARRLLLNKKEIDYLLGNFNKGMKIIPLKVFLKNNLVKIEIALVKNKKKGDKREYLKEKDMRREIKRVVG